MTMSENIMDQNGIILDRIIEHYNLIISLDYLSIKNVLVWNNVMTMSESNKIFLESPTSEEAMKRVICLVSKSPSACKGFVQSLRNCGNPIALHVVKIIDPYEVYGADNGVKLMLDNVVRRFRTAIRKLKRTNSNTWEHKYYSLDSFCKYNTLPHPTTISWNRSKSRKTPENSYKTNSLPRIPSNSFNPICETHEKEFKEGTPSSGTSNLRIVSFEPSLQNTNKRELPLFSTITGADEADAKIPRKKSKLDDMCTFVRTLSFRRK